MAFVHLHVHTCYSLLDGLGKPEQLANKALSLGQKALAITDHGVMYGAIEHYKACNEVGIKPIIGCELYVTKNNTVKNKDELAELPYDNNHLIVLARTNEGHENIRRLVSKSMVDGFYYKPRVDLPLLRAHGKGIIALSGCLAGEIPRLMLRGEINEARNLAIHYSQIFDGFYLELQANTIPEQHIANQLLIQLSEATGIPLVVTCDVHYINQNDGKIHKNLTVLSKTKEDWDSFYADTWMKSEQDILAMGIPQVAIDNTMIIADMCNIDIPMDQFHLPKFVVPKGFTLDTYLSKLCQEGLFKLAITKEINIKEYFERLEYELDVIRRKGLSGYFLIVQDFICWANNQGILTGAGRGSAAGSLISYLLGITQVDPIKHGLLFQRFLNPERPSMPDIDVDFPDNRRSEVVQYISDKYGSSNVCQIITFGSFLSRMVLKDAARILEMDFDAINEITKQIPVIEGKPYTIQESIDHVPAIKVASEQYPEVFELAKELEGIPRQAGTHAAGIVIAPDELVKYIPLCRSKEGKPQSQFAKDTVEDLGLLKIDLLGLRTLTVISHALDMIEAKHGFRLNLNELPLDDKVTLNLISSGNTVGIFQLESEGMQRIFKELNNVTFSALVAGISLYRPGPLSLVPSYISGFNGTRHVDYLIPELEPILRDTYGIILYQEQTMKIATDIAGYTPSQSDALRKAIGKKKPELMRKEMHKLVYGDQEEGIPGMIAKGFSEDDSVKIANLIEKFAGYGFNLSHATCYALIAYQTAYLKAHFPLEYMCALLKVTTDPDKLKKYAQEARRMRIKITNPNINTSEVNFTVVDTDINFGLSAIKGLGPQAATAITTARPFDSLEDLISRVAKKHINKKVLRALALSGALDIFVKVNRMATLQEIYKIRKDKDDISEEVKAFNEKKMLDAEVDTLGFYVSGHPLYGIAKPTNWDIEEKKQFELWGLITETRAFNTKKGDPMCIISLETLEGVKTVNVFTQVYAKCKDEIINGLIVKVKLIKDKSGLVAREIKASKKYN